MFSAILAVMLLPLTDKGRSKVLQFRPLSKVAFFVFVANFLVLMQLGAKHVESPFIEFGQISTVLYFAHFVFIVPFVSLLENTLTDLSFSNPSGVVRSATGEEKSKVNSGYSVRLIAARGLYPIVVFFYLCT